MEFCTSTIEGLKEYCKICHCRIPISGDICTHCLKKKPVYKKVSIDKKK